MEFPAFMQPGEVCWTSVRNLKENPEHASGPGKPRPGILVAPAEDRWMVIGTTTVAHFRDGNPRTRIPPHLWEDVMHRLYGAGYLWGHKVQFVPNDDLGTHIGWASPELRAFAIEPIDNIHDQQVRERFLRLRADEGDEGGM